MIEPGVVRNALSPFYSLATPSILLEHALKSNAHRKKYHFDDYAPTSYPTSEPQTVVLIYMHPYRYKNTDLSNLSWSASDLPGMYTVPCSRATPHSPI